MRRFLVPQRGLQRIGLRVRRQAQVLLNELSHLLDERIETRAFFVDDGSAADERHESAVCVFHAHSGGAFASLDYDFDLPVLLFLRLENASERTDSINLLGSGLVNG